MWKKALAFLRGLGTGTHWDQEGAARIAPARREQLRGLEEHLGYQFTNPALLDQALTHSSFSNELTGTSTNPPSDYESLEFLGDAILGFVIAEFLFLTFKDLSEGQLTKIRSHLVSTDQLHMLSTRLNLGSYMHLSRGEEKTGGRRKKAILADLYESTVAAIYLDGDLDSARDFILRSFREKFAEIAQGKQSFKDSKSSLQECLSRLGRPAPRYEVLHETGPDHEKEFHVAVLSGQIELAQGQGRSKKEAEQEAAGKAIQSLTA